MSKGAHQPRRPHKIHQDSWYESCGENAVQLAQRVGRIQTEIITKAAKFWRLVHDTSIELIDVRPVNNIVVVQYRKQVETLTSLRTEAVHIAALTTSFARSRLYKLMEAVGGDNIIYTDTDSIVFAVLDGCKNLIVDEMGPYLGQLTNDIDGEKTELVTAGPKTYCYTETHKSGEKGQMCNNVFPGGEGVHLLVDESSGR